MIIGEPVRGRIPPPWFWALPGLDRINALSAGFIARPPLFRLFGLKPGHISPGSCTWTMPASEWLIAANGLMEASILVETALMSAATTTLPPGQAVQAVSLVSDHFRPTRPQAGSLVVRARVVNASRFFIYTTMEGEDPEGRRLMSAHAHYRIVPVDPPPPPPPAVLAPVEEPQFATPDPVYRPLPVDRRLEDLPGPFWELLGVDQVDSDAAMTTASVRASEWYCRFTPTVSPGMIASVMNGVGSVAAVHTLDDSETFAGLQQTALFYHSPPADGQALRFVFRGTGREGALLGGELAVYDHDETLIARGTGTGAVIPKTQRQTRSGPEAKRILTTLLFSDIVASTDHAARLGDAGWAKLRDEHHAIVRAKIAEYDGIEVDTAGDGFFVRFESPARALEYARSVRDAVARLGLQLRVGVHTGECELQGREVTGMAVHVAARLEAAAQPGEIVVSEIVKGLVLGSPLRFEDRGERELKGVPGRWRLYALTA